MTRDLTREVAGCKREAAELRARLAQLEARIAACETGCSAAETVNEPLASMPASASPALESEDERPADTALALACEHLAEELATEASGVDPSDSAFLGKVRDVLASAGAARAQRLVDIVTFIDRLGAAYPASAYAGLQQTLGELRRLVDAAFGDAARLLQIDAVLPEAPGPALPVVAPIVLATGITAADGSNLQAPRAVQVARDPGPAQRLAWDLIEELYRLLQRRFQPGLKKELVQALPRIATLADDDAAWIELRGILNVHVRWGERAVTPAIKQCCAAFKERFQWAAYDIAPGTKFDPTIHDAKRYDRIERPAVEESGQVIGLRQLGFLGSDGMPIQQCIAIVSK